MTRNPPGRDGTASLLLARSATHDSGEFFKVLFAEFLERLDGFHYLQLSQCELVELRLGPSVRSAMRAACT